MDSPLDGKRTISRLQETLVEESPDRQGLSAGLHSSFVPNSLENTPSVTPSNDISRNKSIAIEETDEESSPLKSVSISRNESVMESSVLSDDEGQLEEVRDSDPEQSLVEIDSDNSLPCLSVKKKPFRKAVIVSDSESDAEDLRTENEDVEEAVGSDQSENRKKRKSSESSSLQQSKYAMLSSSDNEQSEEQENIKSDEEEEEDLMSDDHDEEQEEEEDSIDIDVDSEDEDFQELSEESKKQYRVATQRAKELYKSSEYEQCLGCILQALEIYPENTALQAFALQVHAKKEG